MTRSKWLIILGTYLVIGVGFHLGTKLTVDLSLTTLSSTESEEYKNYQAYTNKFPTRGGGIVVSLKLNKGFNSRLEFENINQLCQKLARQSGCSSASSLTNVELPEKTGFGIRKKNILKLNSEASFTKSYDRLDDYPDVTPKFLSSNRKAIRVFVSVGESGISRSILENILDEFEFDEIHLSGQKYFADDIEKKLSFDRFWLPIISSLVLLLLFHIWFQDLRSLLVIITILALNSALVSMIFWISNTDIGILTATVPILIIVLSFCDIVHVIHRYKKQDDAMPTEKRIHATIKPLRLSLWLTSLTTFVAFALFLLSGVDEIIDLAVVTCCGIIIAYLTARFVLPVFIVTFGVTNFKRKEAFIGLSKALIKLKNSYRALAFMAILILAAMVAIVMSTLKIDDSFHYRLGPDTPIGKAMRFNDEYFDGTRSIEVVVSNDNVLTAQTIKKVEQIGTYLKEEYGCRTVFSVNSVIKRLNRFNAHGARSEYRIPDTLNCTLFQQVLKYKEELGLGNAVSSDQRTLRIIGRLPDIGSAEATKRNVALVNFLKEVETEDTKVFTSGFSYVNDQTTNRVTMFILLGIILSLLVAGIVSGIVFRSWKIALISILPNLFPLLGALLFIECLGVGLNTTSVMALSILLGLSLDDTIYFLSSNFDKGSRKITSMKIERSLKENTFPVMVTSLILVAGFFILALSGFQSNRNIGLLVGGMLLIAVISDLLILPALLGLITKSKDD